MTVALSTQVVDGPEIKIGYPWTVSLYVDTTAVVFPAGVALMTTDNGLTRVSDNEIRITIAPTDTALMKPGTVSLDIARTDVSPAAFLGITMTIPVSAAYTRPPTV